MGLRLEEYSLRSVKQEGSVQVGRLEDWKANPRPRQVEIRAAWSRDSISVAGVMAGVNYGRDRTIYTQKIPLEVCIAIVCGRLANKMRSGTAVPLSEIQEAAARR